MLLQTFYVVVAVEEVALLRPPDAEEYVGEEDVGIFSKSVSVMPRVQSA